MGRYVALAVTFGAGSLGWLIAVLVTVQRVRLLTRGAQGVGTVVDAHVSTSTGWRAKPGSQPVSPIVEVVDWSTGTPFRFRSWFGSSLTSARLGEQLPVRYLPGEPDMAEIDPVRPVLGATCALRAGGNGDARRRLAAVARLRRYVESRNHYV